MAASAGSAVPVAVSPHRPAAVPVSPRRPVPPCRLALYVYEYLLHVGAQKSAQTFLSEVRAVFYGGGVAPCVKPAPSASPSSPLPVPHGSDRLHASLCAPQIRWEKNITLGEPPGFLHSWWW